MTDTPATSTAAPTPSTPATAPAPAPEHVAAIVQGAVAGTRVAVRDDIAHHPFTTVIVSVTTGLILGAAAGATVAVHLAHF